MTCSDAVKALLHRKTQKMIEFYVFIAKNIGIRGSATFIFFNKVLKNRVPILLDVVAS